jgi:YgiT-type zinc finger domain-containing protein
MGGRKFDPAMDEDVSKNMNTCKICGGPVDRVKKNYRFVESGLDNVILRDIEVDVCPVCGDSPRIYRVNDVFLTIAAGLIAKPFGLTGKEVRFLRKALELNIEDFACKLGVDRSHLSRVENGAMAVSRQTDRLVRTLVLLHRPELMAKLIALAGRDVVLQRLGEIEPETAVFNVELKQTPDGYSFELEQAA